MAAAHLYGGADDDHVRVAAVVSRHERTLLRIARQSSLCDDDAQDAYQRALEIFVRRAATVDPEVRPPLSSTRRHSPGSHVGSVANRDT